MADEEKDQAEGEEGAKPKSKMMLFIIIGVVVVVLGGGAAFFLMSGGDKDESQEKEEIDITYETASMDPIIVNLSQNTRFLKAKLLIEYDPSLVYDDGRPHNSANVTPREPDDPLPGILGKREPMIKDAIIRLLSSKTVEEVLTADGKEQIKEELLEVINEASGIDEGAVTSIYYLEFLVQ